MRHVFDLNFKENSVNQKVLPQKKNHFLEQRELSHANDHVFVTPGIEEEV